MGNFELSISNKDYFWNKISIFFFYQINFIHFRQRLKHSFIHLSMREFLSVDIKNIDQ